MTKHYFKRNRGHSLRSPHVYFEKKRMDREFNLSVRYGGDGEFEAIVMVVQNAGIIIRPIDPQRAATMYIPNTYIEAYADNAGVDIILLDIIYHPVPTVTFRFPSPRRKTAFIDLIRPISSSSDDDSGNSTGSSSDSPSPPQDPHQD